MNEVSIVGVDLAKRVFQLHGSRVTGHGSRVTGHGSRVTGHGRTALLRCKKVTRGPGP
jgi:hypothetical protein